MSAEAAISSAVELLSDLLIQKVKSLRGVEGKVELLRDDLRMMQAFLEDARKRQAEDERVRNWISEIRKVAQDVQDTIELHVENPNLGLLKGCTSFRKRMHHTESIGDKIESILRRIDDILKFHTTHQIAFFPLEWTRILVPPWRKGKHLVGVKDDVKKLLRELKEKNGLSVAVIQGPGGVGKSTLASEIYNHPDVVFPGRFDCRCWVIVSSEFTPEDTIKQLIFQLPRSEQDKRKLRELEESKDKAFRLQTLREMLHQQLHGKPYFIVLDDMWETEQWESLKSAFPDQQDEASRLLVTTRNKTIIVKPNQYEHEMKGLDLENSWELFLKTFIGSEKCPEDLEGIGRQILSKCCGLPLAIILVGGLLVETQTKSGLEKILCQLNSYQLESGHGVFTVIEMNYQNLFPQLKSCFLCLSFFMKNFAIPVERVVNIWVTQGLIQHDGRTNDEIARGYLNELIKRSMVQIEDLTVDDKVKHCRLHDIVREVCLLKAEEEMDLGFVKWEQHSSLYRSRHLVVNHTFHLNPNKHLRSLFLLDDRSEDFYASPYWKSFQLLKILDLDSYAFEKLPDSFQFLVGLKYLRIGGDHQRIIGNSTLQLPSWFNRLKKLEVLEVEMAKVLFPDVALKMERLHHFHVHSVDGRRMKIENWKSIESLKLIRLEDWLECSSILTTSSHLRELGIKVTGKEGSEEIRRARRSLEKMTNLVELHLEITATFSLEEIIPKLDTLTKLTLDCGMLKYCPAESVFPPNLSHLTLCSVNYDPMEELGKLRKLQYLTLSSSLNMTRIMKVLRDGFPCLKALSLEGMHYLKGMDIEEGGMPSLKKLQIRKCPNLETQNLPERIIVLFV